MNAIRSQIMMVIHEQSSKLEKAGKLPFLRVPAPPDGLCAYHSILGSLTYPTWKQVTRHPNGIAVNRRISSSESRSAHQLRGYALQQTPENDSVIVEQALEAQKSTTVDIGELSWLGQSLNLAIRCYITDKARRCYTVVSLFSSIDNIEQQYCTTLHYSI